jgi:hypothetical protein
MNSKQLFQIALGDIHPWFIEKLEFQQSEGNTKELHLYLDFPKGSTFADESGAMCKAYDTKLHTWRHLIFLSTSATFMLMYPVSIPRTAV